MTGVGPGVLDSLRDRLAQWCECAEQAAAPALLHDFDSVLRGIAGAVGGDGDGMVDACVQAMLGHGLDPATMTRADACSLCDGLAALSSLLADNAGGPAADDVSPPIYIGEEERALVLEAIRAQSMPALQAWRDGGSAAAFARDFSLVGSALSMMGCPAIGDAIDSLCGGILRAAEPPPVELADACMRAVEAMLQQTDPEAPGRLAEAFGRASSRDAAAAGRLVAEASAIRIGSDPVLAASIKTQALPEDVTLAHAPDVTPAVLAAMLHELPDNAVRFGEGLRRWLQTGDAGALEEARRIAHTLKGDANTVGVRGLANLAHALEDLLIVFERNPGMNAGPCQATLAMASDAIEEITDHLLGRGPPPDDLLSLYQSVLDLVNAGDATLASAVAPGAAPGADARSELAPGAEPAASTGPGIATEDGGPGVRNRQLEQIERLVGEMLVSGAQIAHGVQALAALFKERRRASRVARELVGRLEALVATRSVHLLQAEKDDAIGLDPLEIDRYDELHILARQLLEAHVDADDFVRQAGRRLQALDELTVEQDMIGGEIQHAMSRARTLPFGSLSARLQRVVRQTSTRLGKAVVLEIAGEAVPVDADMLGRMAEPVTHLLRNAIDHGIEQVAARVAAGKPEEGRIVVRARLQADFVVVDIQDDGGGIDPGAVLDRAASLGLVPPGQSLDDQQIVRLLLAPGFSTRTEVTDVSGRGVGMDIVNQRVREMRGTLALFNQPGQGLRVQMRVPVATTFANVVIVRDQCQACAVVAGSMESVVGFLPGECRLDAGGRMSITLDGETFDAIPLDALFGRACRSDAWCQQGGMALRVRDSGGRERLVPVQAVVEVARIVVKPIGRDFPSIPALRGIAQLDAGELAPVVELDALLARVIEEAAAFPAIQVDGGAQALRIVVADDSASVRHALQEQLADAGYEVHAAHDGVEALELIDRWRPHAVVLDMEMPRMNGLDVARAVRRMDEGADIPIVMITSRSSDKYRAMADEAGVSMMFGKPWPADDLAEFLSLSLRDA